MNGKPLCIRFDKVNGCVTVYGGNRYLVLFSSEIYYAIYKIIISVVLRKGY